MNKHRKLHTSIVHKLPKTKHNYYSQNRRHSKVHHSQYFHKRNRCRTSAAKKSTHVYNVEHELIAENHLPGRYGKLYKFPVSQILNSNIYLIQSHLDNN